MRARLVRRTRAGFTLLELIVAIVVLAILAALAVPAFAAVQQRSRDEVLLITLKAIGREAQALAAFRADGTITVADVTEAAADTTVAGGPVLAQAASTWTVIGDTDAFTGPHQLRVDTAADGATVGMAAPVPHRDDTWVAYVKFGATTTVCAEYATDTTDTTRTGETAIATLPTTCGGTATAGGGSSPSGPAPATVSSQITGPFTQYGADVVTDGDIYVAGGHIGSSTFGTHTTGSDPTRNDATVARRSVDGTWQWAVSAGAPDLTDVAMGVDATADRLYAHGRLIGAGTRTFGPSTITVSGAADHFVSRLDPATGEWLWMRSFAQPSSGGNMNLFDVVTTVDGDVVAVGWFNGSITFPDGTARTSTLNGTATTNDIFMVRFAAADGTVEWVTTVSEPENEFPQSAAVLPDGTLVLAGIFNCHVTTSYTPITWTLGADTLSTNGYSQAWLATADPATGTFLRSTQAVTTRQGSVMEVAATNGTIYLGTHLNNGTVSFGSHSVALDGVNSLGVSKLDVATWTWEWLITAAGTHTRANRVALAPSGDVVVAASLESAPYGDVTVSSTVSPTQQTVRASAGDFDVFMLTVTPAGAPVWSRAGGGEASDIPDAVGSHGEHTIAVPRQGSLSATWGATTLTRTSADSNHVLWAEDRTTP